LAVRRFFEFLTIAFVVALASAGLAGATATVSWSATFHEKVTGPSGFEPCAFGTSCGSGEVVGFGQVGDVIAFGAGCGGGCDIRTLSFADGSTLVMDEVGSNFQAFGQGAFTLDLTDVVVGGTGRFRGARGSATGNVIGANAGAAVIRLSGTVTF
jgi:hypothetical protein